MRYVTRQMTNARNGALQCANCAADLSHKGHQLGVEIERGKTFWVCGNTCSDAILKKLKSEAHEKRLDRVLREFAVPQSVIDANTDRLLRDLGLA